MQRRGKTSTATASCSVELQMETAHPTPQTETTTVPATLQETQEAIEVLLMLGNPPEQENPDQDKNAALMPIAGPQQISLEPLPPAPLEVNPTNPAKTVPK